MKLLLALTLATVALVFTDVSSAAPTNNADGIVGDWLTANGQAKIHFGNEKGSYVGRVVWLKTPEKNGKPITDEKNPNASLRSRQIMGSALVWGLKFDGDDEYTDGHCYDPESGSTYKGKASLEGTSKLNLRGYIGIPLFGRSETWTRVN